MTNQEAIKIIRKGPPDINMYPENDHLNYYEDMEIYNEAVDLAAKALEAVDSQDYKDKRQYCKERTMFDDCCTCINCLADECEGCVYDLMHKGNQV
jgi:hypothetical protein